jgi:Mg/Co/Ni transporter MgtE
LRSIISGISVPLLITSGLTAYIVSSWTLVLLRVLGATRFSPRLYWACGMFGSMRGSAMFGARIVRALALSIVIPFFYALTFEIIGNAELPMGALLGLIHGAIVGAALPLVAAREGCRKAVAPGFFGWRLGAATPLLVLVVYALYGATLGYGYVVIAP